jgi:hypothetical protein
VPSRNLSLSNRRTVGTLVNVKGTLMHPRVQIPIFPLSIIHPFWPVRERDKTQRDRESDHVAMGRGAATRAPKHTASPE